MARRNRPTAFDVSFPEEVEAMAVEEAEQATAPQPIHPYAADSRSPSVGLSSAMKRKNDGPGDTRVSAACFPYGYIINLLIYVLLRQLNDFNCHQVRYLSPSTELIFK